MTGVALRSVETKRNEEALPEFWETLNVLAAGDEFKRPLLTPAYYRVDDSKIYLWWAGAYHLYEESRRRRGSEPPFGKSVLLQYLQSEPYYLGTAVPRLEGRCQRCVVLDLAKAPAALQALGRYEAAPKAGVHAEESISPSKGGPERVAV